MGLSCPAAIALAEDAGAVPSRPRYCRLYAATAAAAELLNTLQRDAGMQSTEVTETELRAQSRVCILGCNLSSLLWAALCTTHNPAVIARYVE